MSEGERLWASFRQDADDDRGSFRDLVVFPAGLAVWNAMLRWVAATYPTEMLSAELAVVTPSDAVPVFAARPNDV